MGNSNKKGKKETTEDLHLYLENNEIMKCVVVGDGAVGKTCMLISYVENRFPEDYVPTVFDNYTSKELIEDKLIKLALFDTAGQEAYEDLRPLSYDDTSVFVVCFSVVDPDSFDNIKNKWMSEIRSHSKKAPVVIVGCKTDLRDNAQILSELEKDNLLPMTKKDGMQLAKDVKADYYECSALTRDGLKGVFTGAIHAVAKNYKKTKKRKPKKKKN